MSPSCDVLVVDQEQNLRVSMQATLQEAGLAVRCAVDANEALAMVRQDKPHLILLDLILPGMSGLELCRAIKQDPGLKNTIVFMLSANADLESKLACLQSGAEEYLVKPVEPRELTARVGRFIKLVGDLKSPAKEGVRTPDGASSEMEAPSLVLEEYSFVRFQSSYGDYRVEALVGKGGMGQVYKAKDEQLERSVAIKVLSSKLMSTPQFVERFRREARVLASIDHPGIASIYAFSEQKGEYYFAMQWCPGGSLSDRIRANGPIEAPTAIDIMLQCAQGLSAAQKKGVVHRDIKPSNLMFDENQMIKVVDFGLASEMISSDLTQGNEFLGTPSYMAPEQAKSPSVDHRADIYSLGITFYHMLYGKLPFRADNPIDMVLKHTSEPFPPFDDGSGKIPRSAYRIIEKMTQKDPAKRYQNYATLIQDLEDTRIELLHQSRFKIPVATRIAPVASLTGTNFCDILSSVLTQAQTGVLTCRWSALEKRFLIRNREIVFFDSFQPDESIWIFLFRKGFLKKEDLPANRFEVEQPLNRFLLNKAFTMEEFKKSYRELMISALDQIFMWPVLDSMFTTADIENDPLCSVPLAEYLLSVTRNILDLQQIKGLVPSSVVLKRTPEFNQVLFNLNLSPEESFIASRLEDENTTIEMLSQLTGLQEEKILRTICVFEMLGALEYKTAPAKPSAPHRMDAGAPLSPPAPMQSPSQAPPRPMQTAALPAAPEPPAAPGHRHVDIPSMAQGVGLQRDSTAATRPNQPAQELQQSMARMGVYKSESMSQMERYRKESEQLYMMAKRRYMEGNYYDVTSLCKQAIAKYSEDARYHMLLAKAYAHHPRFVKDAQTSFHKAIELDDENPNFHAELAQFYFTQGLSIRSINECKKALALAPEHKKATELMAELKARAK